ncbi:MAG: ChbG/HpnK family deacetylase [Lachnospiraceae bacterium]|nr:ChbG/HpnK family deacetylase [Lachnospiraceae bacterium]
MSRKRVDFHADDYGMFRRQSMRILRCKEEGVLTGISILANGPELEESLAMLPEDGLELTVHLNLLGGHCAAQAEKVSLLVDENGIFNTGFLKLLLCPLTGKGRKYRAQIREEYRAQIMRLMPLIEKTGQPLRVDGHAHWHVLPVCYDAIMDLMREGMDIRYIRLPSEPF